MGVKAALYSTVADSGAGALKRGLNAAILLTYNDIDYAHAVCVCT